MDFQGYQKKITEIKSSVPNFINDRTISIKFGFKQAQTTSVVLDIFSAGTEMKV